MTLVVLFFGGLFTITVYSVTLTLLVERFAAFIERIDR